MSGADFGHRIRADTQQCLRCGRSREAIALDGPRQWCTAQWTGQRVLRGGDSAETADVTAVADSLRTLAATVAQSTAATQRFAEAVAGNTPSPSTRPLDAPPPGWPGGLPPKQGLDAERPLPIPPFRPRPLPPLPKPRLDPDARLYQDDD